MNNPRTVDEQAVAAFEAAWLDGKPTTIAEALPNVTAAMRLGTLVEMVLVQIEFSWKASKNGENKPKLVEWFAEQFPELNTNELLQVLLEEEQETRCRSSRNPGRQTRLGQPLCCCRPT